MIDDVEGVHGFVSNRRIILSSMYADVKDDMTTKTMRTETDFLPPEHMVQGNMFGTSSVVLQCVGLEDCEILWW